MTQNSFNLAMEGGLKYLNNADLLTSFSSPVKSPWKPMHSYKTSFVPSLILQSLAGMAGAEPLQKQLVQFLLKQRSSHWSFNYWARQSLQNQSFPYPDDLDDTFCALIGLHRYNPEIVDQKALANIVQLLVATEKTVGGPYQTWLSSSPEWQDIDVAVNANIAYFLQLIGSPLPNIQDFINQAINSGNYSSKYYPSNYPVWYYIARVCPPTSRRKLSQAIQQQLKNQPPNCLQAALALSALSQLPSDSMHTNNLYKQLLRGQQLDGSWPAAAYCLDPSRNGQNFYNGSAPLSTALALEALAKHRAEQAKLKLSSGLRPQLPTQADCIYKKIVLSAQQRLSGLQPELKDQVQKLLTKMLLADPKHNITLLPFYFAQSLKKPPMFEDDFYVQLGVANLFGWIAYTTYDNFLDQEGLPATLSAANLALRTSLLAFRQVLPVNEDFQNYVSHIFDTIDGANTWEIINCRNASRLPRYGQRRKLAERSLGHSLALTAVLLASGHSRQSPAVVAIIKSFRHYLIARQLDDDAHDWQADAAKEHISYVVAAILKEIGPSSLPLAMRLPQMQRQFWYSVLPKICLTMQMEIEHGFTAINENPLVKPYSLLFSLLSGVEKSVQRTLLKQQQATAFLLVYRKSGTTLLKTS